MSPLFGANQQVKVDALRVEVATLRQQISVLHDAFNELFDAVAEDLGYEAAKEPNPWYWLGDTPKLSPRRLAKDVTPERRTIRRNATARCAKRTKSP